MAKGQKREQAAVALAGGATIRAAANAVEVSERTLYLWMKDPEFTAKVDELRGRVFEATMGKMISNANLASRQLRRLLKDPDAKVRLGACKAVMESAVRLHEHVALSARVKALEAAEAERAKKGGRR